MAVFRGFDILRRAQQSNWGQIPISLAPARASGPARSAGTKLESDPNYFPSAARMRLRGQALAMARADELVVAAFSYQIVDLDTPAGPVLRAGGEALEAPRLLPATGRLTALACAACTLGPALERRVSDLFAQRRVSLAMALDELGNELLFDISRLAQDRMQAEVSSRKLTMSGELRAGDPGLALEAQGAVLRLAAAGSIGISLGEGLLMHPLKSTSMILGVGIDLPPSSWTRCDTCNSRARCGMRARALAAATA
jgi:hypothetical protein